jgi:hypothetical protein
MTVPEAKGQKMAIAPRPNPRPLSTEDDASVRALIDEVDADVKAENMRKFFERYGTFIAAGVIAIVLGTAGVNFYRNWMAREQQSETALLIAVMDRDPTAMSEEDLKAMMQTLVRLGKDGHGEGIRFAAGVGEAMALEKKNEKAAAIQRLEQLAKDGSIKPVYRDYALLQKIRMQVDEGDAATLLREVAPLTADSNAWYLSALQLAAILDAKLGHIDEAAAKLRRILDAQDTPIAAREEAQQLLRLYKAM